VALCPDEEQLEALGDSAESYGEADLAVRFYAAARRAAGDAGIEQAGAALALWPRVDRGLLDRLNAANKESVRFSLADKAVARGRRSLAGEASEGATVYHGKRGKWGTWSEFFGRPYQAKRGELRTGVRVAPGDVWKLPRGELRCYRVGPEARFGYFKDDRLASVELRCVPPPDAADASVDVGRFTLFGPRVFVGTPFSDNDPDNCEIVTVDQLRDLGGGPAIPPPPLAGA
jgi:hypothetical protein